MRQRPGKPLAVRGIAVILVAFLQMGVSPYLRADVPLTDITLTDIKKAMRIAAPSAVGLQLVDPATLKYIGVSGEGILIDTVIGRCVLADAHLFTRGSGIDTSLLVYAFAYQSSDVQPPKGAWSPIVKLGDGRLAIDQKNNLVLLKLDSSFPLPPGGISPRFRTDPLEVGEPVIAVYSPYGAMHTVTNGTVSYIDRNYQGQFFLQVDTPYADDCGGPVFTVRKDDRGALLIELVGVASHGVRPIDHSTGGRSLANVPGIALVTPMSVIRPVLINQWQVLRGGSGQ